MKLDGDNAKNRREAAVIGKKVHAFGGNSRGPNAWRSAYGFVHLCLNKAVLVKIPGVYRDLVAYLALAVELGQCRVTRGKCFQNFELKRSV